MIDDENTVEKLIDVYYEQDFTVKTIIKKFPPSDKKDFEKWLKTSLCEDWIYRWDYLTSLKIENYLRMYSQLPILISNKIFEIESPEYQLFEKFRERYLINSIWINELIAYDRVNFKEFYNNKELEFYRHLANLSVAELNLCKEFVKHPKYKLDEMFPTPIYLWFWLQIGNCIKYFENTGLSKPLSIENLQGKKDNYKEWTFLLKNLELDNKGNKTCETVPEFLLNLPVILPTLCRQLLDEKYEASLEGELEKYFKVMKQVQIFTDRNDFIQIHSIYQPTVKSKPLRTKTPNKIEKTKLFISGSKTKIPKC
jgi:hypothetical protein